MDNIKKVFNIVYAKYQKKDYFYNKQVIKNKLKYFNDNNITVKYSDIKQYLKNEKQKCFNMIMDRIIQKNKVRIFRKGKNLRMKFLKKWEYKQIKRTLKMKKIAILTNDGKIYIINNDIKNDVESNVEKWCDKNKYSINEINWNIFKGIISIK